jgi:MFS family permease
MALERACRGSFLILLRAAAMRVAKSTSPYEYEQYARIVGSRPETGMRFDFKPALMSINKQATRYRERDLPLYLGVRFLADAASMGLSVAVGWTVYGVSGSALALGIVGMVQFIPLFLLTLPAGEGCDRLSPRRILSAGLVIQGGCTLVLLVLAMSSSQALWSIYGVCAILSIARACVDPASQALLPFLVPADQLPRAIAWNSSVWQVAVITGPALGGLAAGCSPSAAYAGCGVAFLLAAVGVTALGARHTVPPTRATLRERISRMSEGVAFIRSHPIVLGALSLDLFAVLLGGATALLPIYARDILHVGATGAGLLRSAPAIGAVLTALIQARHPPDRRVGLKLLLAVSVFGSATLVFAFSNSFTVSLLALLVLGASDMVSVNIRASLVQFATPDALRGRVAAVNMLFIGTSSELGAFESGVAAALLGTVPAVALGGIATLVVVALWAWFFPALGRADRLRPEGSR